MSQETKKRIHLIYGIVLTAVTIFAGLCFIAACCNIYFTGVANDVPQIYTRAIVAENFGKIAIPVYFCLAMVIGSFILHLALPLEKKKLGTSDRFNDSVADYKLLTEELGADIREMEGASIVQGAYCAKLPVYSVKAISDVAGSGSTTEQFLENKDKALKNLKAMLPAIFEKL